MLKIKVYFYTAAFAAVLATIFAIKAHMSPEFDRDLASLCTAFTCISMALYMMCMEAKHQLKQLQGE